MFADVEVKKLNWTWVLEKKLNSFYFLSRRWNREQKAAVGSPVFGYMATASNTVKAPVVGAPPYQLTLEDRLRWAQIADVMAQANHYAVSLLSFETNFKERNAIIKPLKTSKLS